MSDFKKLIVQHCSPDPGGPIDSKNYALNLFRAKILNYKISKLQYLANISKYIYAFEKVNWAYLYLTIRPTT